MIEVIDQSASVWITSGTLSIDSGRMGADPRGRGREAVSTGSTERVTWRNAGDALAVSRGNGRQDCHASWSGDARATNCASVGSPAGSRTSRMRKAGELVAESSGEAAAIALEATAASDRGWGLVSCMDTGDAVDRMSEEGTYSATGCALHPVSTAADSARQRVSPHPVWYLQVGIASFSGRRSSTEVKAQQTATRAEHVPSSAVSVESVAPFRAADLEMRKSRGPEGSENQRD